MLNNDPSLFSKNIKINLNKQKENFLLNFKEILCCEKFLTSNSKSKLHLQKYHIAEENLKSKLNVINLISKFNELEKIKYLLLDEDQSNVLKILQNNGLSKKIDENYIKSVQNIFDNSKNNNINLRLRKLIDENLLKN